MGPVGSLRPSCRLGHAVRTLCGSGSPPSRAVLLSCPPRSASLRRSLVGSSCAISKSSSSSLALPLSASSPSSRRASVRSMGAQGSSSAAPTETSVHEFAVKDIDGKDVSLSQYRGKVLLVVNVASQCGLTQSNYKELTELYTKYKDLGLEILAFPSNQFGSQEPGSNAEIKEFACSRFKAEFPIFDKVDVNGADAAPLYKFLKASKGSILGEAIKWNFTKFLVDRDGKVVNRYAPTTSPKSIEKDIKKELGVVAA